MKRAFVMALLLAMATLPASAQDPEIEIDLDRLNSWQLRLHERFKDELPANELAALVLRGELPQAEEPKVEVDPFDARQALQQMINEADDDEIVSYYRAFREVRQRQQDFEAAVAGLTARMGDLGERREREVEEY